MDDQTKGMCLLSESQKKLRMNKNWKKAQMNMHLQTFLIVVITSACLTTLCIILFINDIALKQYTVWVLVPSGIV